MSEQAFTALREQLLALLPKIAGFGIAYIGLGLDQLPGGSYGFTCMLYARPSFWEELMTSEYKYPEMLVYLFRKIIDELKPHKRTFRYMPSEIVTLASLSEAVLKASGVVLDDDTFVVPKSNFGTFSKAQLRQFKQQDQAPPYDAWGQKLNLVQAGREDETWVQFTVVPMTAAFQPSSVSSSDWRHAVQLTALGWNMAPNFDRAELGKAVRQLRDDCTVINANNWLKGLNEY